MKMSDVFALPVYRGVQEVNIHNKERPCIISGTNTTVIARPKYIEATIHAINNHDRMVEEVAELREALPVIKQMIFSMKTNAHTFSNENVEEVSREGRSAMRLIDKLLAKLNQEGEE